MFGINSTIPKNTNSLRGQLKGPKMAKKIKFGKNKNYIYFLVIFVPLNPHS